MKLHGAPEPSTLSGLEAFVAGALLEAPHVMRLRLAFWLPDAATLSDEALVSRVWAGVDDEDAFVLDAEGLVAIGAGHSMSFDGDGADAVSDVRLRAAEALKRVVTKSDDVFVGPPRVFGGFGFEPRADAGVWSQFPAASFVLPRWCVVRDDNATWLELYVEPQLCDPVGTANEVVRIRRLLTRPSLVATKPVQPLAVTAKFERDAWDRHVDHMTLNIANGALAKVVLAQTTHVEFAEKINVGVVLAELVRPRGGLRFVVRRGESVFIGATPEKLIAVKDGHFSADALAASSALDRRQDLEGTKPAREHAIVVDYLRNQLAPIASELDVGQTPVVREAARVAHLYTPVRGRLKAQVHLLEAAARLHPTPAVCGYPVEVARRLIADAERSSRGWYAGAIGFFDEAGEGELFVALRSALVEGTHADVFAGVGLVEDSRAELEYAEANLKARTMLTALGVVS